MRARIYLDAKRHLYCVVMLAHVCVQYATGMAAASQTIIVRTALSYQDVYEVRHTNPLPLKFYLEVK